MLNPKPARAPQAAKRAGQFSLVSAEAQQEMYRALCALNANGSAKGIPSVSGEPAFSAPAFGVPGCSGAEIAEIATCLAAGASCPLVLACPAPGARIVSPQQANFRRVRDLIADAGRAIGGQGPRLTSATLAAMDALLTRSLNGSPHEDAPSDAAGMEVAPGNGVPGAPAVGVLGRKKARGRNARKKTAAHPREEAAIVCAGLLAGGTEAERDYRAAFCFAARHRLPILYVIANRLTPSTEGTPLDLRSIYPEFGIPLFTVDANDAIAAYRVATEALHNARHLRGPSVIEALAVAPNAASASPLELLTAYMERHGNPLQ